MTGVRFSSAPRSFRILGINHLGLAPKDPSKARTFFTEVLGLGFLGEELVTSQMTNTVMIDSMHSNQDADAVHVPTGRPMLKILENEPNKKGPIAAFLEKRGAGIHHIALQVDDVAAAIAEISEMSQPDGSKIRMIDLAPRPGSHNTKIAFIHPESTGGILVELVEQL